ncbi:MAG: hypothetical protein KatS3mg101_0165 [Patescibacteria group bacterium]|nr:MAG: hypothetical protein KatS3mg101_0165 [Patescibacteria group bacterium]
MEKEFSNEDLSQFYRERLEGAGVSSAAALTKAVEAGTIDISLDISKIVSPERQQEILKNSPDSVEVGEKTYGVNYTYEAYYKKHVASITIPMEEIFEVEYIPALPSGRTLVVKVTDSAYVRFSGENLEELKTKAEEHLLAKQWENFKNSPDAPKEQKLKEFDPLTGTLPELPEPVTFGTNPRTHEPALAYPALTYSKPYWSSDIPYSVTFYKTQAEAQKAQEQALAQIEKVKEEKRKEDEKREFLPSAKTALAEVEDMVSQIISDYESFGLTWSELSEIRDKVSNLRYETGIDPKAVLDRIGEVKDKVVSAFEVKEKRDNLAKRVEELTAEKYSTCPLCGGDLSNGDCTSDNHEVEAIQFETDEYGHETGPVLLSQIKVITENGDEKIVVRLMCSAGTGKMYSKGDIYLESGYDIRYAERWEGQLGDLVFEDFGRILTSEERERLKLGESQRPLPEGVLKLGDAIDAQGTAIFAKQAPEDMQWHLVQVLPNGAVLGYKGYRSQATGSSPEELIRNYYKGYPDLIKKALEDYARSKAEISLEDNPVAAASTNTTQITSSIEENEESTGELTGRKRQKLEEQVKEAETKLTNRTAELERILEIERATALNVSSGEVETEIAKPGMKVLATFDKTDEAGNSYAEVVEWPKNRVLHLQAQGLQGQQYVEIVAPVEGGTFHSEDLGLDGVMLTVKKVDPFETDEVIKTQQEKLRKLRRRLGQ